MDPLETYQIYEKGGMIALFVIMYLTTIAFTLRLLMKDREKLIQDREREVKRTEHMAEIVVRQTQAQLETNELLKKLQDAVTLEVRKSAELMTYFKARDDVIGGRR